MVIYKTENPHPIGLATIRGMRVESFDLCEVVVVWDLRD